MDNYIDKFLISAEAWNTRLTDQYRGYERLSQMLREITYDQVIEETRALIGSPDEVARQIELIRGYYGEVEPSLQVTFGRVPHQAALRSIELFGREVMPRFAP
jgi:alkanesulfonate monooxygenase SsuD/methylene tetrahydromethanopterin reductase-like flavin-dependent oxidoreductase (luciferase family)